MTCNGINDGYGLQLGRTLLLPPIDGLRQTEVQHLDLPFGGDHHIVRFEVPVDHASRVSRFQRVCDLVTDSQHLCNGERPRRMLAFDQLQYQEIGAIEFLQSINPADMRVVQRSQRPCLAAETGHPFPIGSGLIRQRFESYIPAELGVVRTVDFPHAAHSQGRHDMVVAKLPAHE
jgi:hypothetical protein